MPTDVITKVIDASNESSSATIHVADDITNAQITAYHSAFDALVLGTIEKVYKNVTTTVVTGSKTPPTAKFAQRELKWFCACADAVTLKSFSFEIPCPDADQLGSTDFLDLTSGLGAAFKTAYEAIGKSPAGNTATLISMKLVGRTFN